MMNPFYVLVRTGIENGKEAVPEKESYFHSKVNALNALIGVISNLPKDVSYTMENEYCCHITGPTGKVVKLEVVKATDEEVYGV